MFQDSQRLQLVTTHLSEGDRGFRSTDTGFEVECSAGCHRHTHVFRIDLDGKFVGVSKTNFWSLDTYPKSDRMRKVNSKFVQTFDSWLSGLANHKAAWSAVVARLV